MLEIYVKGHDQPLVVNERLEALLHDVRVIQGVPFLALEDHGDLVNLNEVWRMIEVETALDHEQVTDSSGGMLHYPMDGTDNAHQGPREGCPVCKIVDDVASQQPTEVERTPEDYRRLVENGTPLPSVEDCPHGYVKGTCSQCTDDTRLFQADQHRQLGDPRRIHPGPLHDCPTCAEPMGAM